MHLVVRDAAAVVDRLERDVAAAAMADVADNVEYRQHGLLGVGPGTRASRRLRSAAAQRLPSHEEASEKTRTIDIVAVIRCR